MNTRKITEEQIASEQARFITKVYTWMSVALSITGFVAYWVSITPAVSEFIFSERFIFYGLLIFELLLVMFLAGMIDKMPAKTAIIAFIFYSFLNGLTLSVIFLIYTTESIASTFWITAGTFALMSAYGYYTKKDLTSIGNLAFMGLIGLIIASIVNLFFHNEMLYWITTYAGILIFVGLTAYDTQKIKEMNIIGNEGTEEDTKESVMGALTLYLDFINLFLYLLRLFGKRK